MSPVDDVFLSGSLDNTIRIWDLKSANCVVSEVLPFVVHILRLSRLGTRTSHGSTRG